MIVLTGESFALTLKSSAAQQLFARERLGTYKQPVPLRLIRWQIDLAACHGSSIEHKALHYLFEPQSGGV